MVSFTIFFFFFFFKSENVIKQIIAEIFIKSMLLLQKYIFFNIFILQDIGHKGYEGRMFLIFYRNYSY